MRLALLLVAVAALVVVAASVAALTIDHLAADPPKPVKQRTAPCWYGGNCPEPGRYGFDR